MKIITQAEFRADPGEAIRRSLASGPITILGENGEPVAVLGGPQRRLPVIGEFDGLDPTDDAAWPLPEAGRGKGHQAATQWPTTH